MNLAWHETAVWSVQVCHPEREFFCDFFEKRKKNFIWRIFLFSEITLLLEYSFRKIQSINFLVRQFFSLVFLGHPYSRELSLEQLEYFSGTRKDFPMDPPVNGKKRASEEPTLNGNGSVKKRANLSNGNGLFHADDLKEEAKLGGKVNNNGGSTMSAAELLEVPQEFKANGLKVVTMRAVCNEKELLQEFSAQDFNPSYVYQYFKEPGDEEAEAEATAKASAVPDSDEEIEEESSNDESEAEEEGEGMEGKLEYLFNTKFGCVFLWLIDWLVNHSSLSLSFDWLIDWLNGNFWIKFSFCFGSPFRFWRIFLSNC